MLGIQTLIVGNLVYQYWGSTSIYRPFPYSLKSLCTDTVQQIYIQQSTTLENHIHIFRARRARTDLEGELKKQKTPPPSETVDSTTKTLSAAKKDRSERSSTTSRRSRPSGRSQRSQRSGQSHPSDGKVQSKHITMRYVYLSLYLSTNL